jgi:hypothetical protein
LQSLALDVKVLTEQREEIEIKIQDDDMSERAQEIGLLMGDEDPRLSQTQLAEREAERERLSGAHDGGVGTAAIDADAGVAEGTAEVEEEEPEEEVDDSAPLVTSSSKRGDDDDIVPSSPLGGLRATMTDDGEIIVDEITDDELPAVVEDEEEDQGYVLEDEDEDYTEEEEEDEGPLAHSTDDDY